MRRLSFYAVFAVAQGLILARIKIA